MERQKYYFDVSYQYNKDGPVGMICLPDIGSVMEWMQRNGESIHFAILLKMPGNADRIRWWLGQQTAKVFLTRKGERFGWFSMAKKQELVDKLGPIEYEAEDLLGKMCDHYCRHTSAASGKTQDELSALCEGCPLSKLGDLIGV